MAVVMDQDDTPLERYMTMRDGESAVSWEAHVGGHAVTMLGIESRPLLRRGVFRWTVLKLDRRNAFSKVVQENLRAIEFCKWDSACCRSGKFKWF